MTRPLAFAAAHDFGMSLARRGIPGESLLSSDVSEQSQEHGEIHGTEVQWCGEETYRFPQFLEEIPEGGTKIKCALCS